jgi:hypothetical protein
VHSNITTHLADVLDVDPDALSLLDRFEPDDQAVIAAAITAAVDRQGRQLDAAIRRTLRHSPRLLRRRVTRALFPETRRG